ncbi:MAG: TolC family protein [Desulfuromonadales bacterium]|nr:TolC family protein [Desulfuromonadales bacterium]
MRYTFCFSLLLILSVSSAQAEPLTLADALAKRSATSQTLKIATMDEQIAVYNVQASRSGYLPRVDIQGGYTAQQAPQSISAPFGTFATQEADYAFLSLGIYQTLYDFGRTDARYGRAKAALEATGFDYRKQEQNVFFQTVTSYFLILQTQKILNAANDEVAQMTDHLRVAKVLYEEGVVTRNNLLQAEVQLSRSRQHRLEVVNRLDNAWLDLNNQIGDPPESRRELVEDTTVNLNDPDKPAQQAVAGRAEILAQRKLLDAGELEVRENKTGYYPEIYARAGLDYVQNDRVKEQYIMAATVGLKINLFDGFATTAHLNQAVRNRTKAEERLRQMESDFALEYRTAVNDAKVAKERINVTTTSITQGEENLRINRDRYQEQVGTATEVIDAQTLLTQIRTEHYQAIFDYQVALAKVKRARGEL